MRVFSTLVAAVAGALSLTSASPLATMSDAELASATTELLAWKASAVGQEAQRRGFLPRASGRKTTTAEATTEELERFVTAKATVARLQLQQPNAVLSLNTPYALLTFDEFLARTGSTAEPQQATATNTSSSVGASGAAERPTSGARRRAATVTNESISILADNVEVDWQSKGCVSSVQHEGACNAGWAFAAVGSIETSYCALSSSQRLYELSEQDILTCGRTTRCDYGITPDAFEYIVNFNGGSLCTEASLPYTRADYEPKPCSRVDDPSVSCDKPDLQVASYVAQNFRDHRDLEAVVRKRAVTAMIYLCPLMQFYLGGVLRGDQNGCPAPTSWDQYKTHHDVLIIGFGTKDGIPYWKVKNSVGYFWGDQGFGYIERGYTGHEYGAAGIEQWNSYPLFKWEMPIPFEHTRVTGPRYNVEILGDDLKTVRLMKFSAIECAKICRRELGCKAYVFYKESGVPVCHIKSSITGERRATSVSDLMASGALITKDDMVNGLCLAPENNVDYPGEDLYHALARDTVECCDMCFNLETCNAYTWTPYHGGSCFLKRVRAPNPEVKAPGADGSAYFRSGIAYKCQPLMFETDFPGNDLGNLPAKGPMDCCGHCRSFQGLCAGYTWTDFNGGTCWLKQAMSGSGVKGPGVFAAFA